MILMNCLPKYYSIFNETIIQENKLNFGKAIKFRTDVIANLA